MTAVWYIGRRRGLWLLVGLQARWWVGRRLSARGPRQRPVLMSDCATGGRPIGQPGGGGPHPTPQLNMFNKMSDARTHYCVSGRSENGIQTSVTVSAGVDDDSFYRISNSVIGSKA